MSFIIYNGNNAGFYPEKYKNTQPQELHPLICSKCGGQIDIQGNSGECPFCGTKYSAKYFIED